MLENINPMLIFAVLGVVIVIGLIIVLDPFGFRDRFTNMKERFDGLTALNQKIFETASPMATPNVVNSNENVPNIKPNSANILNSIIFPEIKNPEPVAILTPNEQTSAEQTQAEQTQAEQTQAEQPSFTLPEMVLPKEETQDVILPSPTLVVSNQNESDQVAAPFILPPTVVSDTTPMQEGTIEVPSEMKEIVQPTEEQSTFALPSLINTNEQTIVPQSSVLTSLEEQNKPVDVKEIVSELPSQNIPQTTADLIKQQIAQPVIKQAEPSVTLPASELDANTVAGSELNNGLLNQFTNSRILGAFPLYK
jgi:hypothetical protein